MTAAALLAASSLLATQVAADGVARHGGELRILTYNLWHAHVRSKRAQPEPERIARHRQQIEAIRAVRPDLVLLQEVTPVRELAREMGSALHMEPASAVANCGLQLRLPGKNREGFIHRIGKPRGFVEGLAILAGPELDLSPRGREKLSGPPALVTSGLCVQFAEVEYAALATVALPGVGRVIVADAHLHASPSPRPKLFRELDALVARGELSRHLRARISRGVERGEARRLREAERLLRAMDRLRRRLERAGTHVAGLLVGGDLNDTPESILVAKLHDLGLEDAVSLTDAEVVTWDPVHNDIVRRLQSLTDARRLRPYAARSPALARLYTTDAAREAPSRLDYVLLSPELAQAVKRVERFAPKDPNGGDLSDHYGLLIVLDRAALQTERKTPPVQVHDGPRHR